MRNKFLFSASPPTQDGLMPASRAKQHASLIFGFLLFFTFASIVFAGLTGSVALSFSDLADAAMELMHGPANSLAASLLELRLSRAFTGFITGATLALSGVMMQALLRNPSQTLMYWAFPAEHLSARWPQSYSMARSGWLIWLRSAGRLRLPCSYSALLIVISVAVAAAMAARPCYC
jgi:hypothetical protein